MYKNNIYFVLNSSKFEWMMGIYNLKVDAWSNLDPNVKRANDTEDNIEED